MDRAQSKEVYSLLHKSVEDASYNFDDPDRDDHSKLQDISDRIFKTADAHKHMVSRRCTCCSDRFLRFVARLARLSFEASFEKLLLPANCCTYEVMKCRASLNSSDVCVQIFDFLKSVFSALEYNF